MRVYSPVQALLVDERVAQLRRSYAREASELSDLAAHAQQLSNGSVNIGYLPSAVGPVPSAQCQRVNPLSRSCSDLYEF